MSNYDERIDVIAERTVSAMYAFWSAMLTAHTVMLSVAVAIPTAISSVVAWQFRFVGFVAVACMVFLLFNFASIRMQYEIIGQRLLNREANLSDKKRNHDISIANMRHTFVRVAEIMSAFGLAMEAVLLAWVLVA